MKRPKQARRRMKSIRPPTMDDVAKLAGVARATVSNVINNTAPVSERVRHQVEAAISELEYRPNALARGLRRNRTNLIGLVIADISNSFYSEICKSIEYTLNHKGFSVVLCNTSYDLEQEDRNVNALLEARVDGFVFVTGERDNQLVLKIRNARVPVVLADRLLPTHEDIPSVTIDNRTAMRDMADYLIGLGHRRIAYLTEPVSMQSLEERHRGFLQAHQEAGIAWDTGLMLMDTSLQTDKIKTGYDVIAKRFAALEQRPSAIVTTSDFLAIGATKALREQGIRVPQQVSITGFDDVTQAAYCHPSITTVRQPIVQLGTKAAEALLELITGEFQDHHQIVLPHSIVVRESTCTVAVEGM